MENIFINVDVVKDIDFSFDSLYRKSDGGIILLVIEQGSQFIEIVGGKQYGYRVEEVTFYSRYTSIRHSVVASSVWSQALKLRWVD